MKTIDLVLPAYNEAHRIKPVLEQYGIFFTRWNSMNTNRVHLVVATNGCTDQTVHVVREVIEEFPEMISLKDISEAVGKGGAIYAAWEDSSADVLGFVDADGATSAEEMSKLLSYLMSHNDVDGVIGSRFIGGATVVSRTSHLRSVMSRFFIAFVRWVFWLPYHDTQCGAKVFRREAYEKVKSSLEHQHLQFDVELLWRMKQQRVNVAELPTIWVDQPASSQLGKHWAFLRIGGSMVLQLLRLRLLG